MRSALCLRRCGISVLMLVDVFFVRYGSNNVSRCRYCGLR